MATNVMPGNQVWEHLGAQNIGRIVTTAPDGTIEVFPVNYVTQAHQILIRTRLGTKFRHLATHPDTVFEVDDYDAQAGTAWSIVIHAHAHVEAPAWAHTHARRSGLEAMVDVRADELVVLTPDRLSARLFHLR